jgi:hypothetical protein
MRNSRGRHQAPAPDARAPRRRSRGQSHGYSGPGTHQHPGHQHARLSPPTDQHGFDHFHHGQSTLGDLNSYREEDPARVLLDAGYVDLVERDRTSSAPGYIFDGRVGTLDYGIASASFAAQVQKTDIWSINSDESKTVDYEDFFNQAGCRDCTIPFRSADHDPISIALAPPAAPVPSMGPGPLRTRPFSSRVPSAEWVARPRSCREPRGSALLVRRQRARALARPLRYPLLYWILSATFFRRVG